MKKRSAWRPIEVNLEELDRIIEHGMRAPLSESDGQKIRTALHAMAERLTPKRSTEKISAVLEKIVPKPAVPADDKRPSPAGHGRHGAGAFTGATRVSIPHPTLQSGDGCPECGVGKVYRQKEPATLVRIVGQAPLKTTIFEMARLRCNACGQIFTAAAPETAGPDKYDATAVAMIALLKYGTGVPFNRLERLEGQLAMPLPAATQWELMEAAASLIRPVLNELIRQAAQGRRDA
jgi:rubredoxin